MSDGIITVLWIVWVVALLVVYHKVVAVYYFDLSRGLLKELVGAAILGAIMTGLTLFFWYVVAIIIILIGLGAMGKTKSAVPLIIAIVLAIIIAVIGIPFKKEYQNNKETAAVNNAYTQDVEYGNNEDINTYFV